MDNFIYAQVPPNILRTVPEYKNAYIEESSFNEFPFIKEFASVEIQDVTSESLSLHYNLGIEICYIHKGKYHWQLEDKEYVLLPGDCFITFPWQKHGSTKGFADIGRISWLILLPEIFEADGQLQLGFWSQFSKTQQKQIADILLHSERPHFKSPVVGELFKKLHQEFTHTQFGYEQVVHTTLDDIFVNIIRSMLESDENSNNGNHPDVERLERSIIETISEKWTIDRMCKVLDTGQTSLNLLLKRHTGLSPGQFLMDIRIKKAMTLIKESNYNLTDIAFQCGFCSSQHFTVSFKNKTGMRPKDFLKKRV